MFLSTWYRDGVLAGEACIAEAQLAADCDLAAGLERQEAERIDADDLAHFLNRAVVREQLVALRDIGAEEAGMTERGAEMLI